MQSLGMVCFWIWKAGESGFKHTLSKPFYQAGTTTVALGVFGRL